MMQLQRSLDMQERARGRIPGMTQLLSKRPDMFSLGVWPGYFAKAEGARVTDLDGNVYTDMSIAGIGANILGYADPEVNEAVIRAVRDGVSCSLNCPEEVALAELLCELHPWAAMARFTRSGGEAAALAIRVARARTSRDTVAICGYHGWHDWYLAVNLADDQDLNGHLLPGLSPAGVPRGLAGTARTFRFNQPEELLALVAEHGDRLAAIIMEPLRDTPPTQEFAQAVFEARRRTGALLVFDEISAGFRLCSGGVHLLHYEETPDMAVFSKALGNGFAISAVIGTADAMKVAQDTFISSTNWTERIGPTAALATLTKHRKLQVANRLVALGLAVQRGWARLGERHGLPLDIGGIPPLSHFAFRTDDAAALKALFIQHMLEEGFLASNLYYAMYVHTDSDVDAYLDAADRAFGLLAQARTEDRVEALLRGKPATAGFKRLT